MAGTSENVSPRRAFAVVEVDPLAKLKDREIERDLISSILTWPEDASHYCELEPHDFGCDLHQPLWRAICEVISDGVHPELSVVRAALERANALERAGGLFYLAKISDGRPRLRASGIAFSIRRLKDLRRARDFYYTLKADLEDLLADPQAAVDPEWVARRRTALEALGDGVTATSGPLDALQQVASLRSWLDDETSGGSISLGFQTLDDLIGPLRAGDVLGVMARPGIGKTRALAMIAGHVAARLPQVGQLILSLELATAEFVEGLIRPTSGLGRHDLRDRHAKGTLDAEAYIGQFGQLLIEDRPGLTVAAMESAIAAAQAGPFHGLAQVVVGIDHLALVGGDAKLSTYDRVSKAAREIKDMAKRRRVVIVLLIQANRATGADGSEALTLASARDSGAVEEVLTALVALWRPERAAGLPYGDRERMRNIVMARLLKNRRGELGDAFALRLDPRTLRLTETTL